MKDVPAALRDLADADPVPPLDVDRLVRTAVGRRRRRTALRGLAGTAAAAVAVTAGALALPPDRVERLVGPAATPSAPVPSAVPSTAPPTPAPGAVPSTAPPTPAPGPQPPSAPPAGTRRVTVYFATGDGRCDQVRGHARDVPRDAPLRPALEQLFAGPREDEQAPGGGEPLPVGLRSVRVTGDRVYVDLDAARFPGVYTTSCGGASFGAQLRATVQGIVPGARIIVALDGDPERYVQALQGFCPEPAAVGDRCDASGFRGP